MANLGSRALDQGQAFPALEVEMLGGGRARLPEFVARDYGVILFLRGHW
jgi:hypothetical protein